MNLHRSFHLTVEDKHSDLISFYRWSFNSRLHQQEDANQGIYKKWMPMPENDYAYILDISKDGTRKKFDDLIEGSETQEADTGLILYNEIIQNEKLIRVVRIIQKTRQTEEYRDLVLVHAVSQEQIEIQRECLKKNHKNEIKQQINSKKNSTADRTKENMKEKDKIRQSFEDDNEEDSLEESDQITQNLENNIKKKLNESKSQQEEKGTQEYPIIVKEDIQSQQEELLEVLHKKKQRINSLKLELANATERAQELQEKMQASEEKAEESDLLRRSVAQQNIEKDLLIQQMRLLVKQKQEEIDGLKQENKNAYQLQKEVKGLNSEADSLRKQLLQAEESQLSLVHLKEQFKKKLHLEMMFKEKILAKSQKKQLKIKELRAKVQGLENQEQAAQKQRERDDEHFQQVQEYLIKELENMKEQKEEAERQLEKYKNVFKKKASGKINKKYIDEKEKRKEERKDKVIKVPEVNKEVGNNTPQKIRDIMDNNMIQVVGVNTPVRRRSNSRNRERMISDFQSQQQSQLSQQLSNQDNQQQQSILDAFNNFCNNNQDSLRILSQEILSQEINPSLQQSSQVATPQKLKKTVHQTPSPNRNKLQLTASQIATIQEQKAFNQRLLENGEYSAVKLDNINKCCDEFKELCSLAQAAATSLELNNQLYLEDQLKSSSIALFSPIKLSKKKDLQVSKSSNQLIEKSKRYHIKEDLPKKANSKILVAGAIAKNAIINPFSSQLKKVQNYAEAIKSSGQLKQQQEQR